MATKAEVFVALVAKNELLVGLATHRSQFRSLQMAFKILRLCNSLKKEFALFSFPASLVATRDSRNGAVRRKQFKTLGTMRAEQINDREQVSEGGHFMELLVS